VPGVNIPNVVRAWESRIRTGLLRGHCCLHSRSRRRGNLCAGMICLRLNGAEQIISSDKRGRMLGAAGLQQSVGGDAFHDQNLLQSS